MALRDTLVSVSKGGMIVEVFVVMLCIPASPLYQGAFNVHYLQAMFAYQRPAASKVIVPFVWSSGNVV